MEKIAEGKTKIVYSTSKSNEALLKFKDDITALDGEKHDILPKKGMINAAISATLFRLLEKNRIPTHFIKFIKPVSIQVRKLNMIIIEVICRNIAAGHLVKNYPFFNNGEKLKIPLIEFYLKNDALHDPLLSEEHLMVFNLANRKEIYSMKKIVSEVNRILTKFMRKRGFQLVDFKLEFGRDYKKTLRVGDELNIDSMRLWEMGTNKPLDKDIYRQGGELDKVSKVYLESYKLIVGKGLE